MYYIRHVPIFCVDLFLLYALFDKSAFQTQWGKIEGVEKSYGSGFSTLLLLNKFFFFCIFLLGRAAGAMPHRCELGWCTHTYRYTQTRCVYVMCTYIHIYTALRIPTYPLEQRIYIYKRSYCAARIITIIIIIT